MFKKTLIAATALACGLFAMSSGAVAADSKAPTPVPYGQQIDVTPTVSMADAVAQSEKAYDARATSARLRTAYGDLFWCVRLEKADGERLAAYVDAKTGEIMSAQSFGKTDPRAVDRGYRRPYGADGMHGHHRGPGCGGWY